MLSVCLLGLRPCRTEIASFSKQKVDALYGTQSSATPRKKSPAVTVTHLSPEVEAAKRSMKAAKDVERARSAAEQREHIARLKRAQAAPSKLKDSIAKQRQQSAAAASASDVFYSDNVTLYDVAGMGRSGVRHPRDIPVEVCVPKGYEKLLDDIGPSAPATSTVPHHRRLLTGSKSSFSKSIKRIAEGMERLEVSCVCGLSDGCDWLVVSAV
jgi:hypothetical protein